VADFIYGRPTFGGGDVWVLRGPARDSLTLRVADAGADKVLSRDDAEELRDALTAWLAESERCMVCGDIPNCTHRSEASACLTR
jgi:hypothetical protein